MLMRRLARATAARGPANARRALASVPGVAAPSRLRVPSGSKSGGPSSVERFMPLLHELSIGARRGNARWVPTPALLSAERTSRRRSASWLEITYPFSTDDELRNVYMLADGDSLRAGRFLEELDAFSADCAFRHCDGTSRARPLTVVTAAHDGLALEPGTSLTMTSDLRLRGAVVNVGRSSMEVQTDVLRVDSDGSEEYTGSVFTIMVARDAENVHAASVHRLVGGDSKPWAAEAAKARSARRRQLAATALDLVPPADDEVPILHELWRSGGEGGGRVVPMAETVQTQLDIQQPAHRNMNGFMFGGYIMRRALEVGWLSAYRFTKRPPRFVGLDDVAFKKPVPVGSLIEFVARVAYAADNGEIRVHVKAERVSLRSGRREMTNQLNFTFGADADAADLPTVRPDTYEEGMVYLEGRRRAAASLT